MPWSRILRASSGFVFWLRILDIRSERSLVDRKSVMFL
jgi:hypothetical protein